MIGINAKDDVAHCESVEYTVATKELACPGILGGPGENFVARARHRENIVRVGWLGSGSCGCYGSVLSTQVLYSETLRNFLELALMVEIVRSGTCTS